MNIFEPSTPSPNFLKKNEGATIKVSENKEIEINSLNILN